MTEKSNQSDKPIRSVPEAMSFGVSLLLLALFIGLVVYGWIKGKDNPPILVVQIENEIRHENGQFYVPFSIENIGGETAAAVQIVAELKEGTFQETGEQQIDFLSGGEVEKGAFIFTRNPEDGELKIRVASYTLP